MTSEQLVEIRLQAIKLVMTTGTINEVANPFGKAEKITNYIATGDPNKTPRAIKAK